MKDSYTVKEELQIYLKFLESQRNDNSPNNNFTLGKISGVKSAIDFIDGYLYCKNGELFNKY